MEDLLNQIPVGWTVQFTPLQHDNWLVVIINKNYVEVASSIGFGGYSLESTLQDAITIVKDKSEFREVTDEDCE